MTLGLISSSRLAGPTMVALDQDFVVARLKGSILRTDGMLATCCIKAKNVGPKGPHFSSINQPGQEDSGLGVLMFSDLCAGAQQEVGAAQPGLCQVALHKFSARDRYTLLFLGSVRISRRDKSPTFLNKRMNQDKQHLILL